MKYQCKYRALDDRFIQKFAMHHKKKKIQHLLGSAVTVKETTRIINQMFLSKMNLLFAFFFTHKGITVANIRWSWNTKYIELNFVFSP